MTDLFFTDLPMILHAGCITAAPLLWATLGGAFSERSGVVNIGLEGMMLIGAFAGVAASGATGNPWLGLLAGALAGGLFGLLHALICLWGKADQIVSGMGLNLMAYGMTGVLLYRVFETRGNSPENPPKSRRSRESRICPSSLPFCFPFLPCICSCWFCWGGRWCYSTKPVLVCACGLVAKTRMWCGPPGYGSTPTVIRRFPSAGPSPDWAGCNWRWATSANSASA